METVLRRRLTLGLLLISLVLAGLAVGIYFFIGYQVNSGTLGIVISRLGFLALFMVIFMWVGGNKMSKCSMSLQSLLPQKNKAHY